MHFMGHAYIYYIVSRAKTFMMTIVIRLIEKSGEREHNMHNEIVIYSGGLDNRI